jgi:CheY-like chemotaxis protein
MYNCFDPRRHSEDEWFLRDVRHLSLEALTTARSQLPDLLISDVVMPDIPRLSLQSG